MSREGIAFKIRSLTHLCKRYAVNSDHFQFEKSITATNIWIIDYLIEHMDEDIYQKDLETMFTVNRSTTSKVIKLMEQKGLIERQAVPNDARLKKLLLTPKALGIHKMLIEDITKLEKQMVRGFRDEEIRQLSSYIGRMKANLQEGLTND
ncbi:transcriptional regulator [Desulfitobacterium dichloroeliminans LMG P-21439]|uniref:Transcriptional regulator n=1 Tax=Desulfitobacterium dichloroeliminans (strain LMG P-21439 / DCA1) TaxID=871963 RepID=L0F7P8_DESDL|nr:MarR family transcriptional regulator [Desulfitobacterium dichloroeliminans]AGA69025.1 transcriptional regulator [Desulfitobacterium dichloroeliminans LMG P-21439]